MRRRGRQATRMSHPRRGRSSKRRARCLPLPIQESRQSFMEARAVCGPAHVGEHHFDDITRASATPPRAFARRCLVMPACRAAFEGAQRCAAMGSASTACCCPQLQCARRCVAAGRRRAPGARDAARRARRGLNREARGGTTERRKEKLLVQRGICGAVLHGVRLFAAIIVHGSTKVGCPKVGLFCTESYLGVPAPKVENKNPTLVHQGKRSTLGRPTRWSYLFSRHAVTEQSPPTIIGFPVSIPGALIKRRGPDPPLSPCRINTKSKHHTHSTRLSASCTFLR